MEVKNSFGPIDISLSGMGVQGKQMEMISSNIANARTTDGGNNEPYRRLEALFSTESGSISGVTLDKITKDQSEFDLMMNPGHPNADEKGYVQMPNVVLPIEMMNMVVATRTYQANVAALKRYQKMVETTLELLR
ncbi:MAG: flagellar basal body rod protein FlgC [Planctomycetota bacterium]|jgi:flagellar basal-body rod protein FlgC